MIPSKDFSWGRSSLCSTSGCVEVARDGDVVLVRDSKLRDASPVLTFTRESWVFLLGRIVEGGMPREAFLRFETGGVDLVQSTADGTTLLAFSREEWAAFDEGVKRGEFDLPNLVSASVPARAGAVGVVGRSSGHRAAALVAEGDTSPASFSATSGSPAGWSCVAPTVGDDGGPEAGQSGCGSSGGEGGKVSRPPVMATAGAGSETPGPAPVVDQPVISEVTRAALVDLVRPDFLTGVDVEDWAREWAEAAFATGVMAALKTAVDDANAWARAIAPLVEHVPSEEARPVPMPGVEVANTCRYCVTSGEVAPVAGGTPSAGATEPGLCDCSMCRTQRAAR